MADSGSSSGSEPMGSAILQVKLATTPVVGKIACLCGYFVGVAVPSNTYNQHPVW